MKTSICLAFALAMTAPMSYASETHQGVDLELLPTQDGALRLTVANLSKFKVTLKNVTLTSVGMPNCRYSIADISLEAGEVREQNFPAASKRCVELPAQTTSPGLTLMSQAHFMELTANPINPAHPEASLRMLNGTALSGQDPQANKTIDVDFVLERGASKYPLKARWLPVINGAR